MQLSTALRLVLAANTAFAGFPRLASILARDAYWPRQFQYRGDRLAFSTGILVLTVLAGALLVVFRASVTNLIPLYTVGVFIAFTLSQTGMVRRWWRLLAYIEAIRTTTTRPVVVVLAEFVPKRFWQYFLHNQTALRLKFHLYFQPGVIVVDVPTHSASRARR